MPLKLKRLGGTREEPFCVEIQQYWPDPTMILIHLERMPGLEVHSKTSAAMTDDVHIEFSYKGYPFTITSPFAYPWVSADAPDVPETNFEEIVEHLRNYTAVWPHQLIRGMIRHWMLPRWRN